MFSLLKGTEADCKRLVDYLNTLLTGVVKFTYNYSEQRIEFLDLEISIVDGRLETDLYIKPSNLQLYLHYFSNHPEHCKAGIVYSQALRVIERCSSEEKKVKNNSKRKNGTELGTKQIILFSYYSFYSVFDDLNFNLIFRCVDNFDFCCPK